jgi:hypothetical protein
VYTGKLAGAGTDSSGFVTLHGDKFDAPHVVLKKVATATAIHEFRAGTFVEFRIVGMYVGTKVNAVTVGCAADGVKKSWYVEKVRRVKCAAVASPPPLRYL